MPPHPGSRSDDKGPKILAVLWSLTILTTIIVSARMYIRCVMLRNPGIDDYLITVSLFLGLVYCGITTANVAIGYGKHAYVLDERTVEQATLLNSLSFLFGILSMAVPKLAVTAMLNRILNPTLWQRTFLWVLTGSAAVFSCVCIVVLFTMCDPPSALWKTHLVLEGKATCRDMWTLIDYAIFTGAISAFVDLYLAIYPSTVLLKLQMSLRKRLALSAALGLGAVASAMAIVKCTQLPTLADKSDYTYGTADLVMWTNVESDVFIIASCIPTLRPVIELIFGWRMRSLSKNSRDPYNYTNNQHCSSYGQSKLSKKPPKSDIVITNVESQESILREEDEEDEDRCSDNYPLGHISSTGQEIVRSERNTSTTDQGIARSERSFSTDERTLT